MPLIVLLGYAVGSVPFALLLAKRWGTGDLRLVGSGNVGAANVMRASGVAPGLLAAVLDVSKGMASVLIAERLAGPGPAPALAGLAAVVGHIYPIWIGFRGGKGVATACGVFAMLTPVATMGALFVFLATVTTTRYVSLGSVLATVTLPPLAYLLGAGTAVLMVACAAATLIVFRHRSNLGRLWTGTERRVGRLRASRLG
jgi:glycerol-3-phosphate acyltransferase PlsY